jgi:hypothetical protein
MMNRLSNSQLNKFQTCPKSYEFFYKYNLKGDKLSSALLFGSAFDKGCELLVHSRNLEAAKQVFTEAWTTQEIDGQTVTLKHNKDIQYFKSDYDPELVAYKLDANSETMNVLNWESLLQKGLIMLNAVFCNVLPRLGEILSTQELVSLKNEDGDEVIGYVDLVAVIDGKPAILDFKTASSAYDENSVKVSQQLTLYTHILQEKYKTRTAGFIVIGKKIKTTSNKKCDVCGQTSTSSHKTCNNEVDGKRCNNEWSIVRTFDAPVQILLNEIPVQTENLILDNIEAINKTIKTGVFTRNLSACFDTYGKPCEYVNLCWHGTMDGIKQFERKSK